MSIMEMLYQDPESNKGMPLGLSISPGKLSSGNETSEQTFYGGRYLSYTSSTPQANDHLPSLPIKNGRDYGWGHNISWRVQSPFGLTGLFSRHKVNVSIPKTRAYYEVSSV